MPGRRNLATFFRFRQHRDSDPSELLPNAGTVGSQCASDSQEMSAIVLPRLLVKSALVTVVQRGTMPKVPN